MVSVQDIKSTEEKHAPALRAISKAMRVRWYNAERIAQYGRSRATLDAQPWRNDIVLTPQVTP